MVNKTQRVYYYQDDTLLSRGDTLSSSVDTLSSHIFTTPANCNNIAFQFSIILATTHFLDGQIELGTTATPYEPYTESTQYLTAKDENGDILELRSLPNGVADEISDGKLIQRVGENEGELIELATPIETPIEASGTLLESKRYNLR